MKFVYSMKAFLKNRHFRIMRCLSCRIDFKIIEFDWHWSLGYSNGKRDVCPRCGYRTMVQLRDLVIDREMSEGSVVVVGEVAI